MKYFSTRDNSLSVSFKDAVITGLAPDGGLILPKNFPQVDVNTLYGKSYEDIAFEVMSPFADDIPPDVFKDIIKRSYAGFSKKEIVPVVDLDGLKLLELFHGATAAFKDIALQFLGNLFEYILNERSERLNIIGATSGDTGSAAIHGVKDKERIKIIIFYPYGRVSPIQEAQMLECTGSNIQPIAIEGDFDDCQRIVKTLFSDKFFKEKYKLGAVNSINWARILAQMVYYFHTYAAVAAAGSKLNFAVPTGNFGNIFAGYCAKRMGLPIEKLILATNNNDILHRFISNGDYSVRKIVPSHSPSMDIQLASNFERYLYYLLDSSDKRVKSAMDSLLNEGRINFTHDEINIAQSDFVSYVTDDVNTEGTIKAIYDEYSYILDPHTACGVNAAKRLELAHTVVLATASPAKFPEVVKKVLKDVPIPTPNSIKKLTGMKFQSVKLPNNMELIKNKVESLLVNK
jgi:threonine synthase